MPARDEEITPLIRGLFLPEEGEIWAKDDASQQEFRFLVHYAAHHKVHKADIALERYRGDPDADFHALAGQMTGLERKDAKAVNFAKIYGAGVKTFAVMIGKPLNEARTIYEQYDRELPFLYKLSEIYQRIARRQGYVTLYDGARRHFDNWAPGGKWKKGAGPCERAEAQRRLEDPDHPWFRNGPLYRADIRNALNALIQGSAARHTKLWMRLVWREGIVPLLQMHDALECSVASREQAEMVAQLGVKAINLKIPMRVDLAFGRNWGVAKHTWDELHDAAAPPPEPPQGDEPDKSEDEEELELQAAVCAAPPPPPQPAPPQPPSARADDGYRRGEAGGIPEDFDFSADLAWPGVSNGSTATGASAKTNGGTQSNASSSSGSGASTSSGTSSGTSTGRSSGRMSFIYRTANGTPHMKVVRTPAKSFPTYHWTGHGWGKGWPQTVVPYRLPELIAASASEPVWITEGEKDANNVAALGLIATTNPGGAKVFQPELAEWFKGKELAYTLEDNDEAGRAHTAKITAALHGIVPEIVTVAFPELPEKGDVSDWLEAGGNKRLLIARAEEARKRDKGRRVYIATKLSTVTPRAVQWVWGGRLEGGHLALGTLELLAGTPEIGKSQIHCQYVACTTTGRPWPNGAPGINPRRVIMLTAEDTTDTTLVPRLKAAGANLDLVEELNAIRRNAKEEMFLLAEDLDKLEQMIRDRGDVGLVTVDPITAYMGHDKRFDSHRATDVRSQLSPLKRLAERTNVAFSAITHPPKNASPRALDHFIGSQAFIAAARIGHLCVPEMEATESGGKRPTGRCFYTNPKINIAARQPTLIYRVAVIPTGDLDDETGEAIKAPVIQWEGQADITADEALAATKPTKGKGGLTAQDFLADYLAGGPQLQTAVIERGAERGFTERQLRHAKAKLSVVSFKKGFDNGAWFWALPEHVPQGTDVMDNVIQFPKPEEGE